MDCGAYEGSLRLSWSMTRASLLDIRLFKNLRDFVTRQNNPHFSYLRIALFEQKTSNSPVNTTKATSSQWHSVPQDPSCWKSFFGLRNNVLHPGKRGYHIIHIIFHQYVSQKQEHPSKRVFQSSFSRHDGWYGQGRRVKYRRRVGE